MHPTLGTNAGDAGVSAQTRVLARDCVCLLLPCHSHPVSNSSKESSACTVSLDPLAIFLSNIQVAKLKDLVTLCFKSSHLSQKKMCVLCETVPLNFFSPPQANTICVPIQTLLGL